MVRRRARLGLIWALGSCLLGAAVVASAREEPPAMDDACLNDHGGMVGPRDSKAIQAVCEKARKEGIALTVVTVQSLEGHKSRLQSMERFVDDLFEELDVEYDDQQNAILLFISRAEREIRVRVGDGYPDRAHKAVSGIIRSSIGPQLRRNPSGAVRKGVERLWQEIGRPRVRELEKDRRAREQKRGVVNFEDDEG
jgi:uncharacterized protein